MKISKAIEEIVFELLNFDIHEVSIVDHPANDQPWLAIKGMTLNAVGDYVSHQAKQVFGDFDTSDRASLLTKLSGAIKAMTAIEHAVNQTTPKDGAALPSKIQEALSLLTKHMIGEQRGAALDGLAELAELAADLDGFDLSDLGTSAAKSQPDDQAIKRLVAKAVDGLATKDRMIAKLRRELKRANARVIPSQATSPDRFQKLHEEHEEQDEPKPDFPYMYNKGKPSHAGS